MKSRGEYVNASTIGSRTISSSKITLADAGNGITVETNNIYWVSEGMYANALITAGSIMKKVRDFDG